MYKWEKCLVELWYSLVDRVVLFFDYFKNHYVLSFIILAIVYLFGVGVIVWHS